MPLTVFLGVIFSRGSAVIVVMVVVVTEGNSPGIDWSASQGQDQSEGGAALHAAVGQRGRVGQLLS